MTLRTGKTKKRRSRAKVWKLRLYVAGQKPNCLLAFANLKRICAKHLAGNVEIEVIDLLRDPQLSRDDHILAIPTLVRLSPRPVRKLIGDLSNMERALAGLNLACNTQQSS